MTAYFCGSRRGIPLLSKASIYIVVTLGTLSAGEASESLEQRVTQGDAHAFVEAADLERKDLIPTIERFASNRDDPSSVSARTALAKLGVTLYLDEIVSELNLTNTTVSRQERLWRQGQAFKKLAYIKDRSTVRLLASFLYGKENPEDYAVGHVIFDLPSEMAMQTLAQIVTNPPTTNLPGTSDTHDARVKTWQQWWEQNKDKYP